MTILKIIADAEIAAVLGLAIYSAAIIFRC